MNNVQIIERHIVDKQLLQFIKEKGKEGEKLREVWINLGQDEDRAPPACIISQIDRLIRRGDLVEVREHKSQGYMRRFFYPSFGLEPDV